MTSRIVYEGGLRTTCTHLQSGSTIETDAPTDNQGKGERFSPTDMVGTSLAACMLTTMAIRARDMEDQLRGIGIEVEKIMSANPRRISRLNIIFHIPEGFIATEEQKRNLENIAMTCPVKESIHPDIVLDIRYNW
jgi:putative redox protein